MPAPPTQTTNLERIGLRTVPSVPAPSRAFLLRPERCVLWPVDDVNVRPLPIQSVSLVFAASAIAFPTFTASALTPPLLPLPSPFPLSCRPHRTLSLKSHTNSVHVQTDDKRLYSSRKEREREDQSVVRTQLSTQLRNREPKASQ